MKVIKELHKTLFLIVAISVLLTCEREKPEIDFDNLDILEKIESLEGVAVMEIVPNYNYSRAFQIEVTQPVDHYDPDGDKFTQRVYLLHADESMPMVFAPSGYAVSEKSLQEIAYVLGANCLNVAHRYFRDSKPSPLDWKHLTVEQAAADHHRIVELFKNIYKDTWISSGRSKSGQATLFHKRYYPNDVNASVAYVTPFVFGPKDMRFEAYMKTIGAEGCYNKLREFQRLVLENRLSLLALVDQYIQSISETWSMDHDMVLELAVMDYPWTFWQENNMDCSLIPNSDNTDVELFNHLNEIVPMTNFCDGRLAYYLPYAYQAITETGAPGFETDYFSDLLNYVDPADPGNPIFELVIPQEIPLTFNYSTIPDIYSWLQNNGNNIIYCYGDQDPWTAGAIELDGATNAVKIVQAGANHRVYIEDLDEKELVYSTLEEWLEVEIPRTKKSSMIHIEDQFVKLQK